MAKQQNIMQNTFLLSRDKWVLNVGGSIRSNKNTVLISLLTANACIDSKQLTVITCEKLNITRKRSVKVLRLLPEFPCINRIKYTSIRHRRQSWLY